MPVFPLEAMTGCEFGAPLVVLPNLVVSRVARLAAQSALFEDISFRVAIQFEESRFLAAIPSVGQNDQYLSLHNAINKKEFGRNGSPSIFLGKRATIQVKPRARLRVSRILCLPGDGSPDKSIVSRRKMCCTASPGGRKYRRLRSDQGDRLQ